MSNWVSAKFIFPPVSMLSPSLAESPFPGRTIKSFTSSGVIFSASAAADTAFASGCSLLTSSEYASFRSSFICQPSAGSISVTSGSPLVTVPVLSSTTVSAFPVSSSAAAVLNSMPLLAPMPFPPIMATGVASPSAHGQLMTSTDIALARAKPAVCPASIHTANVMREIPITAGTNTADTLSAALAAGALVAAASPTIFIICDSVVSSPTLNASHLRNPD